MDETKLINKVKLWVSLHGGKCIDKVCCDLCGMYNCGIVMDLANLKYPKINKTVDINRYSYCVIPFLNDDEINQYLKEPLK